MCFGRFRGYWWFLSCDLPQFIISLCPGAGDWVLINHKVREREQFMHLTRWGGQHSRNESTNSRRGWWEGRTLLRTRPRLPELQMAQAHKIYLASQMLQESAVLQTPREGVYSTVAKMWKARHPISHICKRTISSHDGPGSVLRKSCHRSQGGNRSNLKHFTLSKRESLWIGNAISLSISMGKVNHLPTLTKIIPELKLIWNGQRVQMRFWSDVHFKYKKKQIGFSVNKNYNCQVRTVTFS